MYITVHIKIPYRKVIKAKNTITQMSNEGWTLTDKNRGFFSTTYSFSKII